MSGLRLLAQQFQDAYYYAARAAGVSDEFNYISRSEALKRANRSAVAVGLPFKAARNLSEAPELLSRLVAYAAELEIDPKAGETLAEQRAAETKLVAGIRADFDSWGSK